jgi:hypothetical protein
MKSLEKEAELYADRIFGFANENHSEWENAQRHIINFCEQSKWIEAEKINAQIEILELLQSKLDGNITEENNLWYKIQKIKKQLKKLEDESNLL